MRPGLTAAAEAARASGRVAMGEDPAAWLRALRALVPPTGSVLGTGR
jgi:hypothetical protein